MYKIKSLFILVIAGILLVGCSGKTDSVDSEESKEFNSEGLPIVDDEVNLSVTAFSPVKGNSLSDYKLFKEAEKDTNVNIDWQLNPGGSDWQEKKNLMFVNGDLSDVFYGHGILDENSDIVKYGTQGVLIPLEDLIDEYAPNVKELIESDPDYKKALTAPDGHIYSLPTLNEDYAKTRPALFINKKWLDELDLPLPETTDEFYETLKAFKENDMAGKDDVIPFSFMTDNQNMDLHSFFGSFGLVDRRHHIAVEDDEVIFTGVQPEFKDAIQYFSKLFDEDLVDPESFSQDQQDLSAKVSGNKQVGSFVAWATYSVDLEDDNNFVPLPPLEGPNGDQKWAGFKPGILFKGSFSITASNPNPEIAMRWIDYMYEPEKSMEVMNGLIGDNVEKTDDGKYKILEKPEDMSDEEFNTSPATSRTVWAFRKEMADKMIPAEEHSLTKEDIDEIYEPYLDYNEYPKVYFTEEENKEISKYMTDIESFVDKKYANWMVHGGLEEEWDDYLKKIDDMGLDKMVELYQQAYDRYQDVD